MRYIRRLLLPLVLLSALSACQTWNGRRFPGGPSPQALPSPVRVTLTDGSVLVMWSAEVRADSVIGMVGATVEGRQRVAVAIPRVRRVEGRGVNFPATVALTAAITFAFLVTVLIATLAALNTSEP
jgi:hypothetical protein